MARCKEERNKLIVKEYGEGASIDDLMEKYQLKRTTILEITRDCRRKNAKVKTKLPKSTEEYVDKVAIEESKYMDVLYSYTASIVSINECAMEGMDLKRLKKKVAATRSAFDILAGSDGEPAKSEDIQNKTEEKHIEKSEDKTAKIVNKKILYYGWLRCPRCGKKLHKVTKETKLEAFPLWCKMCHKTVLIYM